MMRKNVERRPERTKPAEARPVFPCRAVGQLGEQSGGKRDGYDAVRELIPRPGVVERRRAVRRRIERKGVAAAEGDHRARDVEEHRRRHLESLFDHGVAQIDAGAVAESLFDEGGDLDAELKKDADRGADGEPPKRELAVPRGKGNEGEHHDGHDDVVDNRRERGHQVGALSVEDTGDHRPYAVEQDLDGEDAEEENREFLRFAVADGEGLRFDDGGGEERAGQREEAQGDDGEREDVGGEAVGSGVAMFFLLEKVEGQERRCENARWRRARRSSPACCRRSDRPR